MGHETSTEWAAYYQLKKDEKGEPKFKKIHIIAVSTVLWMFVEKGGFSDGFYRIPTSRSECGGLTRPYSTSRGCERDLSLPDPRSDGGLRYLVCVISALPYESESTYQFRIYPFISMTLEKLQTRHCIH